MIGPRHFLYHTIMYLAMVMPFDGVPVIPDGRGAPFLGTARESMGRQLEQALCSRTGFVTIGRGGTGGG
jgi:hypothetical protein